jgi:hypothetical protein
VGGGCGVGQASRGESDRTGVAARLYGSEEADRRRWPAQSETQAGYTATFMEFVAPGAKPVTNCTVEVESVRGGKLRLDLKAIATAELVDLIRAFVIQ